MIATVSDMIRQACRQPPVSMIRWNQGSSVIEPMPTPEKASPTAIPRRLTNQW